MPSSEGISTRVSVLGDKEYKKALQDIGRRLTMLNTEMAATNSAFGDQADSMEAMRAKASSLQSVYDAHAEKVKLIAEQLNKAKAEYGENSQQAENLQIALNRAANAMNKVGNEIKENDQNMAALADATQQADSATDGMADAMSAAGDIAGGAMKAGLEAAAAAIAAPLRRWRAQKRSCSWARTISRRRTSCPRRRARRGRNSKNWAASRKRCTATISGTAFPTSTKRWPPHARTPA